MLKVGGSQAKTLPTQLALEGLGSQMAHFVVLQVLFGSEALLAHVALEQALAWGNKRANATIVTTDRTPANHYANSQSNHAHLLLFVGALMLWAEPARVRK